METTDSAPKHADLDKRQCKAIAMLATGTERAAVCTALGITERTLYNWRRQPLFEECLAKAIEDATNARKPKIVTTIDELEPIAVAALHNSLLANNARAAEFVLTKTKYFERKAAPVAPGFRVVFGEMPNDPEPDQKSKVIPLTIVEKAKEGNA